MQVETAPLWRMYDGVRAEILVTEQLLHWSTVLSGIVLLVGAAYVERRTSVVSVLLAVYADAWAAAVLRLDYLIQRQGAYARTLESALSSGPGVPPLWEAWKAGATATPWILPLTDLVASLAVVGPALFVIWGPFRRFLREPDAAGAGLHGRRDARYAVVATALLALPLLALPAVPALARWHR